jgi:hypothetical protein
VVLFDEVGPLGSRDFAHSRERLLDGPISGCFVSHGASIPRPGRGRRDRRRAGPPGSPLSCGACWVRAVARFVAFLCAVNLGERRVAMPTARTVLQELGFDQGSSYANGGSARRS